MIVDALLALVVVVSAAALVGLAVWARPRRRRPRAAHIESKRTRT